MIDHVETQIPSTLTSSLEPIELRGSSARLAVASQPHLNTFSRRAPSRVEADEVMIYVSILYEMVSIGTRRLIVTS